MPNRRPRAGGKPEARASSPVAVQRDGNRPALTRPPPCAAPEPHPPLPSFSSLFINKHCLYNPGWCSCGWAFFFRQDSHPRFSAGPPCMTLGPLSLGISDRIIQPEPKWIFGQRWRPAPRNTPSRLDFSSSTLAQLQGPKKACKSNYVFIVYVICVICVIIYALGHAVPVPCLVSLIGSSACCSPSHSVPEPAH